MRLIRRAIERTRLDLKGLRVLTEASVGYRRVTPVIAALAGADEVYAVGRDSVAGLAQGGRGADRPTSPSWRASATRVKLLSTRLQAPLATVDVVTDLPGVRPIDESIIRNVAETAAVTLMRGAAHWRPADVDVATCRRHGIAVAGVDEEAVGLYRYSPLAVRRRPARPRRRGRRRHGSWWPATDRRRPTSCRRWHASERACSWRAPETAGRVGLYGGEKAGDALGDDAVAGRLRRGRRARALPGATGDARSVGPGAPVDAARLAAAAPHLAVVGLGAETDLRALGSAGLRCRPAGGPDGVFDLLPQAVVAQHVAGLKVAEVMTRARRRGSSPVAAEQLAATEAHAELLPKDLSSIRR